jgi:phosphoenolpyruvate carboxykinase (ATP)
MVSYIVNLLNSISKSLASTNRISGPNLTTPEINEIIYYNDSKSDFGDKIINIHYNLCPAKLYEFALQEKNTRISSSGALSVYSGSKTGRSPKDKRVVLDENTKDIWWDEKSPNIKMDPETFLINRETAICYLNNQDNLFVFDGFAGWDKEHQIKIRIISTRAYHGLFMHNMLIRPNEKELENFGEPDYTIFNSGVFPCNRNTGYMTSSTSIDFDFTRKEIVILGTQYAGEMKKGIFSVIHYLMPIKNILSLHSSVNESKENKQTTIFFGLSGTGKTTLSADPNRNLIGDDEHCWTSNGVFNIEGGCYAKCIGLNPNTEPVIYNSIKFGSLLENIIIDSKNHNIDFNDTSITSNTRVSYPINYVSNAKIPCIGTHPNNIILLSCDAFGILPPISKLTHEQAMYYFISGYTAKIPGTEEGITLHIATFSACFGEAFLVWHPFKYADLLKEKLEKYNSNVWLINTGWCGGIYGKGNRYKLSDTRTIIDSIHSGELNNCEYEIIPDFNLKIPKTCSNLNSNILNPINSWKNKDEYKNLSKNLSEMFINNFTKYKTHPKYTDLIIHGPKK